VLTAAEQHLVQTLSPEKGRDLLKRVRTQLLEVARPVLSEMVAEATNAPGRQSAPRRKYGDRRRGDPVYVGRRARRSGRQEEMRRKHHTSAGSASRLKSKHLTIFLFFVAFGDILLIIAIWDVG
jgi:hypothetical protein